MEAKPAEGDTASERLYSLFKIVTRAMCRKPKYARAVLRAMASGEPEIAANVAGYQERMNRIIVTAMRGPDRADPEISQRETLVAAYLQRIWFASLVGWSAGLQGQNDVVEQMRIAGDLLLDATKSMK